LFTEKEKKRETFEILCLVQAEDLTLHRDSKSLVCILLLFVVLRIEEMKIATSSGYKDYNINIKQNLKPGLKSH
jgi:hypothetical protein